MDADEGGPGRLGPVTQGPLEEARQAWTQMKADPAGSASDTGPVEESRQAWTQMKADLAGSGQ